MSSQDMNQTDSGKLVEAYNFIDEEADRRARKLKAADNITSHSWFCVFPNPRKNMPDCADKSPREILEYMESVWCGVSPTRVCGLSYCVSNEGTDKELEHIHACLEDSTTMRFSKVRKCFPGMHIEPTKGNKKEAEDYINKVGKYSEKNEIVLERLMHGDIKGNQGARTDLARIQQLLDQGFRPNQIVKQDIKYRRYEKDITAQYMSMLEDRHGYIRKVEVEWHYGNTGSGKSYGVKDIIDEYGIDNVHIVSADYENAFDFYYGQEVLVLDEFRANLKYGVLLDATDKYLHTFKARYISRKSFWKRVIIISPMAPDEVYQGINCREKNDGIDQLYRRIQKVYYHWSDGDPTLDETVRDVVTIENLYELKKNGNSVRTVLEAMAEFKNNDREKVLLPNDYGYQNNIDEWIKNKNEIENNIDHQITIDDWLRSS